MDDHFEKYYLKAVFYLKFRQRSVKEMRDYLQKSSKGRSASGRKNTSDNAVIEKVITRLEEERFLNDREFVKSWIESRARFRPKGKRIIELELRQKGIAKELIDEVMQEEAAEDIPNEAEQLRRLVQQRIGKYKGMTRYEIYQKLGTFLARRGYTWDLVKRSIDDVLEKEYN